MIRQQKKEKEDVQERIKKLCARYEDLESIELIYKKKREEFEDKMTEKRQCAQKIKEWIHSPYGIKKFAECIGEELYGSDYKIAEENMTMFYEEVLREKDRISVQIEEEERKKQMAEQKIMSLERLIV